MGRGDVKVRKFRYLNRNKVKGDVNTHLDLLNALSTKDLEPWAWRQDSPVKIEGSHGAIQGGGDDDMARGGERHSSDPAGVLRESDKAEATEGVPHLDLERGAMNTAIRTQIVQPDTGAVLDQLTPGESPVPHDSRHLWVETEGGSESSNKGERGLSQA